VKNSARLSNPGQFKILTTIYYGSANHEPRKRVTPDFRKDPGIAKQCAVACFSGRDYSQGIRARSETGFVTPTTYDTLTGVCQMITNLIVLLLVAIPLLALFVVCAGLERLLLTLFPELEE